MMDAAYFVGRKELLDFFNSLLDINLTKIEQTATGAVACQLTEMVFPRSIPMSKVNWEARSDYEFVQNYKLLQVAFTKNRVQRHIDVDKLIRAKYQDNLEFCQWLKAFYDQSGTYRDDYDPVAVRHKGKGGKRYAYNKKGSRSTRPRPRPVGAPNVTTTKKSVPIDPSPPASPSGMRGSGPLRERAENKSLAKDSEAADLALANETLMKENAELTEQLAEFEPKVAELELAVIETEKERDFYFEKLRYVEVMCQVHQEKGEDSDPVNLLDKVFKVLYAVPEDQLMVDEEGEIVEGGAEEEVVDAV